MLKKIMLPALLVMGMSASADDDSVKGLIGVEVGYINTSHEMPASAGGGTDTADSASIGLKLGAEGRHYRVFVDGRYWHTDEYYSGGSVGAAIQYLIRPTETFNIFLGLNAGFINTIEDTRNDAYYGIDAGINLDLAENFGIEVGGRVAACGGTADFEATSFYQGYASAIFKFTTDY